MQSTKPKQVELFFDVLDQSSMLIHEETKKNYLECLLITVDVFLNQNDHQLGEALITELEAIFKPIMESSFQKEVVRKAFQLAMFKGFKHIDQSIGEITPDSIGMLFAYFIDCFYKKDTSISILDPTVGTGNLLMTILNNSHLHYSKIAGIDINYPYIDIAYHMAKLLDYDLELIHQDLMSPLKVSKVDCLVSDLPIQINRTSEYLPYVYIKHLMSVVKPGGYYFYLIENDFFNQPNRESLKEIILSESYIQALIELPISLFSRKEHQKSILILQKKGDGVLPVKDMLIQSFPKMSDQDKVKQAITQINHWFKQNK